jgi:DNA-binding MarR family transcriptional regulator
MNITRRDGVGVRSLLQAAQAAQDAVEVRLQSAGLSMAKLVALRTLAEAGERLPLSQLAERLSCVKSNVTQLVDRLEADGLVARRADPHDRRARIAVLTTSGRKACQEGSRIQKEAERDLLKTLTRDEVQQLASLLEKIGSPSARD